MKRTKIYFALCAISAALFVAAEAIIFYLIHIARAEAEISLHYLSIQIAALFSWIFLAMKATAKNGGTAHPLKVFFDPKAGILITMAMLFTLGADYHLVVLPEIDRLTGMKFFIGTQICIFLHLILQERSKRAIAAHLITRVSLTVVLVALTFVVLGDGADALAVISLIYYANLLTSMIFAPRDGKYGWLLCLGLILFALCDANVGLSAINDLYGGFPEGSVFYKLLNSDVDLAWIFYIPSQTIIPLTILTCGKNKQHPAIMN